MLEDVIVLDVPAGELLALAGGILAGGIVTGILAGVFGVGGGAIIVPVLYEIFRVIGVPEDVRMQLCLGTSLAIIIPTSIRSFRAHLAKGQLPVRVLRQWAIPMVLGVMSGGLLAATAPSWVFKLSFVVFATLLCLKMFFGRDDWRLGTHLPGSTAMTVYGLIIGLYAALMGVGGGAISTLILTLYGQPIHAAIGISAGVGVFMSIAGSISYALAGLSHQTMLPPFSIGFVSLLGFVLMAPITTFVAPYGARLAYKLSRRQLEIAFGCFLLIVSIRFVISLVW